MKVILKYISSIFTKIISVVLFLSLIIMIVFYASYYRNYFYSEFRQFSFDCKNLNPETTSNDAKKVMSKYELVYTSNADEMSKLAYRLNSNYPEDRCYLYLSKDEKLIKTQFALD